MLKNRIRIGNIIFAAFIILLFFNYLFAIISPTDQTDGSFRQRDFLVSTIYSESSHLKIDDVITHINGDSFTDVVQNRFSGKNYYKFKIGDEILYTVERNGETLEIPVLLEKTTTQFKLRFGYNYLICLFIGIIGYITLITSSQTKNSFALFAMCFGVGLTMAPGMFQAYNITFPLYMMVLYFVTSPISGLSLIAVPYFFSIFPTDLLGNKKKLFLILNIALFLILVVPTLFLPIDGIMKHYFSVQGFYFFALYIGIALIISTTFNFIKTKDPIKKQQLKYISLGLLLSFLPLTFFVFLPFLMFRKVVAINYEIITTIVLIFPLMTAFAIKKYNLFNIRKIASKTLTYALTSLITTSISIIIFAVFSFLLKFPINSETIISLIPVIIFTSISAIPLQNGLENLWMKVFHRNTLKFFKASETVLQDLAQAKSYSDLFDYITKTLPKKLQIKNSLVLLIKEDGIYTRDALGKRGFKLSISKQDDDYILLNKISNKILLQKIPLLKNDMLKNFSLIMPLTENDETIALWLLGEKSSDDFYYTDELKTIDVIGQQLSLSLLNAKLLADIEEKLKKEKEVVEKELELNKLKGEYITIVSHFLRTPITAAKGYIDLLQNEITEKKMLEYINGLSASTQKIQSITERIIIMSELEKGELKITKRNEQLSNLLESITENFEATSKEYDVKIKTVIKDNPSILAERGKLKQAISNILENAIVYNKPKGTVQIALEQVGNEAVITIQDNGRGISEEELKKIFTPFHRAHFEKEGFIKGEGIGIGIYLSKLIINAHKGKIEYQSEIEKGTTVTIKLPIIES